MSSALIPVTKTAGGRPPYGGPPPETTFDPRPDGAGEPIHRRVADSVRQVLIACMDADADSAGLLRRLVLQRKRAVQRELDALRLLDTKPMPPLIGNLYSLDFLSSEPAGGEVDVERLYVWLLECLDEADGRLQRIPGERNG